MSRCGIVAGGNWIRDKIRFCERGKRVTYHGTNVYPVLKEGTLANVLAIEEGTGGSSYNTLTCLAKLETDTPLGAIGIVGDDPDGHIIMEDLKRLNIDKRGMRMLDTHRTSFTDVYQPAKLVGKRIVANGNRAFGHYRGANDTLSPADFSPDFVKRFSMLYVGYALLLKGLDAADAKYGTRMARVLHDARVLGLKTSLDAVSDQNRSRFRRIVAPSLPHTDVFMPNEYEAGCILGKEVKPATVKDAATELFEKYGVGDVVVIHMGPDGSFGMLKDGTHHMQRPQRPRDIVNRAGAGDAFNAGMAYGLHRGENLEWCMRFGTAMATICLEGSTCTNSMLPLEQTLDFMERQPYE